MDNEASGSSSFKGKAPLNQLANTVSTASGSGSPSSGTSASSTLSAIATGAVDMAKNTLAALDPRHADVVRLNGAMPSSALSSSSSSSGKPSTSGSRSAFQHASRAMETLSETPSSSASTPAAGTGTVTSFRTPASAPAPASQQSTGVGGLTVDWDSFLASPEADLIDNTPYRPPSMSSFTFSSMERAAPSFQQQQPANTSAMWGAWEQRIRQEDLWRSAHASHPDDTIPAFAPPTAAHVSPGVDIGRGALVSHMVQQQQMEDGRDVVEFLNSTSHADYVEALEAVEVERHQHQRKQFQYDAAGSARTHMRQQDLPSDQQDIVAYVEGQGTTTIADDIDARPFAHDEVGQELRSLMAERTLQEQFLQRMMALKDGDQEKDEKEMTLDEMAAIMDRLTLEAEANKKQGLSEELSAETEKTKATNRQAAAARRRQQNGPRL